MCEILHLSHITSGFELFFFNDNLFVIWTSTTTRKCILIIRITIISTHETQNRTNFSMIWNILRQRIHTRMHTRIHAHTHIHSNTDQQCLIVENSRTTAYDLYMFLRLERTYAPNVRHADTKYLFCVPTSKQYHAFGVKTHRAHVRKIFIIIVSHSAAHERRRQRRR